MAIPERQIIVCQSFRVAGDKKGICHKQTDGFLQYLEEEILDRGLDCLVTASTCLKQCESGPIMVIQPENWWFKGVDSEEAIDTILDGLEDLLVERHTVFVRPIQLDFAIFVQGHHSIGSINPHELQKSRMG